MKRASRAIPSLIAEGWSRRKLLKNFRKYLREATGEANEMISHLEQSKIFGFTEEATAKKLIEQYDKVAAKLFSLRENWQNF